LACDYLINDIDGTFIDGTFGGGGHAAEILSRLSDKGKLLGYDKDLASIEHGLIKYEEEITLKKRLVLFNISYSSACSDLELEGKVQGFLLDLGLSSFQLDKSTRGFSYRKEATLDMRFGSEGETAKDIINFASEEELTRIIRNYGEEPFWSAIIRRILQVRRLKPICTTFELNSILEQSVPKLQLNKSLARVYQAFRIAVNNELTLLEDTLPKIPAFLASGGRLVIIAYHSLEDRIVKNFFRSQSISNLSKNKYKIDTATNMPKLKIITRKPILPSENEILFNPRARSAKMRVAEKN
jgi:16S rRNA (cytosine1402-N4)-methyltransferase